MPAPSFLSLANLNGRNGFRLKGIDASDYSGNSVASAGDVNGDGFGDVIVGAPFAERRGYDGAGESYLIFGSNAAFPADLSLADLNGANGYTLFGAASGDRSGNAVSAGDLNGDGIDDLVMGAFGAKRIGILAAGETFVYFGSSDAAHPFVGLNNLNGANGFRISGIDGGDYSGVSVSSGGDLNGDGFDDVVIGAHRATPNGLRQAGESYVVFGSDAAFPATISLADINGTNGFRLDGARAGDRAGSKVAFAGDVNGDGFDDLIIGAPEADPNGNFSAGSTYVVFGGNLDTSAAWSLADLNGLNGFRIDGIATRDFSGDAVASAGDLNGDGFDDLIIGAKGVDREGQEDVGESYVVFGRSTGFDAAFSLADLDGVTGFRLLGVDAGDFIGVRVSAAGDINRDGFADLIIGALGEAYVVYGKGSGFAATLDLSDLSVTDGFRIQWKSEISSGLSVSGAGDMNGDGYDDLIVGVSKAEPNGYLRAGESYVIFGAENGFVQASVGGAAGNDWLSLPANWQDGLTWIDGGAGTDMMSFAGLDAGVYVNTHTDKAVSGLSSARFDLTMDSIENVTGTSYADVFNGSDMAEFFRGLGGMDTFYASHAGADRYDGGAGTDRVTYQQSGEGVSASLLRGRGWSGDAEGDRFAGLENLTGSHHDDFLWGDHGNNRIEGLHGDDVIIGNGGDDYILAAHGTDTIVFSGNQADYTITRDGIRTEVIDGVAGRDGHDVIGHAEILRFADGDLML